MSKVMPHNEEAEQSVLGSILLAGKKVLLRALKDLAPSGSDFYYEGHGKIFKAMIEIDGEGLPIDMVTLLDKFKDGRGLEGLGGETCFAELLELTPTAANVAHHIKIVKDNAARRNAIYALTDACANMYDTTQDSDSLISTLSTSLVTQASSSIEGYHSFRDLLGSQLNVLDDVVYKKGQLDTGIKTGLAPIDNAIGGFITPELIIIAGRPSMGKSALINNIILNITGKGKRAFVFSLEVSKEQYIRNLLSIHSEINTMKWRTSKINEADLMRINEDYQGLADRDICIDDSSNDVDKIVTQCNLMAMEQGSPDLIVTDHLQEMRKGSYKGYNRKEELDMVLSDLRRLARMHNCPVVSIQQLNRKCEERADKRPIKSDLQDTGGSEQKADMILFVYRDAVYNDDVSPDEANICEVIISKMRNGNTGTIKLYFEGTYTKFRGEEKYVSGTYI